MLIMYDTNVHFKCQCIMASLVSSWCWSILLFKTDHRHSKWLNVYCHWTVLILQKTALASWTWWQSVSAYNLQQFKNSRRISWLHFNSSLDTWTSHSVQILGYWLTQSTTIMYLLLMQWNTTVFLPLNRAVKIINFLTDWFIQSTKNN